MKPEAFQICVSNNDELTYFPGEVVEGVVNLVVGTRSKSQECRHNGIKLTFKGKAFVSWNDNNSNRQPIGKHRSRHVSTNVCTAKEIYFNSTVHLVDTDGKEEVLHPGKYEYPFKFTLPNGIPSSFTDPVGAVSYKIQAEMVRPGAFRSNLKAKVPFTVKGLLDLNMVPLAMAGEPMERKKYKNVCCLCCTSGSLGFKIILPRTRFIPETFLEFMSEFSNQTGRRVQGVTAYIIQLVTFSANESTKEVIKTICKAKGPAVEPGETESWSGNILKIPPVPSSGLAGCNLIDIKYFLKIEMHVSGLAINLRHNMPLIIGYIPPGTTFQQIDTFCSNITANTVSSAAPS